MLTLFVYFQSNFSVIISCSRIIVANYIISTNVWKYLFLFPDYKVNYKNTVEGICKNNTSLIFKCNSSMSCSTTKLIYHEALIFSVKFIFSKEYYFHFLHSRSLKRFEWFLLSLPPSLNCSNNKLLSLKYKMLAPDSEKWSVSFKDFFRKCECISSCYLPILLNLLKMSLRKTSLFMLFELLPTGLFKYVWPFITTQHEWVNNFMF